MKQRARNKALDSFKSLSSCILLCSDVAARGLDIPGVDCVIQYDPPQKPELFLHRAGRTARLGQQGYSVIFLLPKEEAYVEYQRERAVPLTERKCANEAPDVIPQIRTAAMKDRNVMQKGLKAFVSFMRAYKEHRCSDIFRLKELEIGKLGMGFGVLRLPSMPEVKRYKLSTQSFVRVEGINVKEIKFKDKYREKQRQKNLELKNAEQKEECKPKKVKQKVEDNVVMRKKTARQRRAVQSVEDDEEMAREYRLMKKLKRG